MGRGARRGSSAGGLADDAFHLHAGLHGQSIWLLLTSGLRRGEVWMIAYVGATLVPGDQAWGFEERARRWHTGNEWWD